MLIFGFLMRRASGKKKRAPATSGKENGLCQAP
jgi:hypothetical protein